MGALFAHSMVCAQDLRLELVRTFTGHQFGIRKVSFSPDEQRFASGGTRGEVYLWDVNSGGQTKDLRGHFASVSDLHFSADGKFLVSAADDGQVIVWDLSQSKAIDKVSNSPDATGQTQVRFALITHDNKKVYFAGHDTRLNCKSIGGETVVIYNDRNEAMRCAQLSPDGSKLMVGAGKLLLLFDAATGKLIREYNTGDCVVNAIQFSADGKKVITWCENARVDMRDPETMALRTSFKAGTGNRKFSNLAFTKDQRYIVTGDHAARFNVWDLEKRRIALDQTSDQGTVLDFDISSNPTMLLSGSMDRTIKLWKITENPLVDEKGKKKPQEAAQVQQIEVITYETDKPGPTATVNQAKNDGALATTTAQVQVPRNEQAKPVSSGQNTTSSLEQAALPPTPAAATETPNNEVVAPANDKKAEPVKTEIQKQTSNEVKPEPRAEPQKQTTTKAVAQTAIEAKPERFTLPEHPTAPKDEKGRTISVFPERLNGRRVPPVRTDHKLYFMKPQITITVWDAQVVDGDIITLYMNDTPIITEYSISETRKSVAFDGTGYKRCYLMLHAHNLGTIPPNTVTMLISDGEKSYQIEVRSDLTNSSGVELNFD